MTSPPLTQAPGGPPRSFLDFPLALDLERLEADIAILGIPFGMPYSSEEMANDQSLAPDAIRQAGKQTDYTRFHYDWDLGGPLLDDRAVRVVDGGPYYLTIDADGLDPTIMPAVMAQTPGGLTWLQVRELIHGLVLKGRVLGMDLVEIAPSRDQGRIPLIHAERLLCNVIGACVRAGYYD